MKNTWREGGKESTKKVSAREERVRGEASGAGRVASRGTGSQELNETCRGKEPEEEQQDERRRRGDGYVMRHYKSEC